LFNPLKLQKYWYKSNGGAKWAKYYFDVLETNFDE